jgi:predicted PurR-regulated permease PerM
VLGLYILIQQLESNLLVPLIQERTVELPPVLGMFAIVALGMCCLGRSASFWAFR